MPSKTRKLSVVVTMTIEVQGDNERLFNYRARDMISDRLNFIAGAARRKLLNLDESLNPSIRVNEHFGAGVDETTEAFALLTVSEVAPA